MTQTIAQLADDTLTITSGEFAATITVKQIAATWDARSHFPESRARLELAVLEERLNNFARRLEELEAPAGALNAAQETEAYTRGHVELTRRAWALESHGGSHMAPLSGARLLSHAAGRGPSFPTGAGQHSPFNGR